VAVLCGLAARVCVEVLVLARRRPAKYFDIDPDSAVGVDTAGEQLTDGRQETVNATAGQAEGRSLADRFGIEPGMVVMEMGYDDDVDEDLRDALIDRCGELVDEDTDEVVDVVLLWWRDGDGDLVDTLVDALGPLADSGVVWLVTPKAGRPGHVEPSEVNESAPTAGLQQTSTVNAGKDWTGARLVARRAASSRR
jgi:hypothetical protein